MSDRHEASNRPGADDRAWLSPCQLVAVAIFLTLFACLVVWTTAALPGPFAEVNVEALVSAVASLNGTNARHANYAEAP
jgi:hypothetical protein